MMRRGWKLLFLAPLAIGGMILFVALGGALVQFLWNWLLPGLFGWPVLTFWQALALLALCRILFGGLGRHGRGPGFGHRMGGRWSRLSCEERDQVRRGMRERFAGLSGDGNAEL